MPASAAIAAARALQGGSFVDGEYRAGGTHHHDHHNPATGEVQAQVAVAGGREAAEAADSAAAVQQRWAGTPGDERRDILLRIADLVVTRRDEFAELATLENGAPISLTPALAATVPADWFRYYAGWADKIDGDTHRPLGFPGFGYTVPEPFGVIAAILSWNGPMATIGMKVAPALAAGNCVVLKPPDAAPFTALRFAELAVEAGLPPGVLNAVVGGPDAGEALLYHQAVGKVSFTGGVDTARHILRSSAERCLPVVMELGGKSANIVFPDVNLERVIAQSVAAVTTLSGQMCTAPTRLLVHESIYRAAVEIAEAAAGRIAVGDPRDPTTTMGPLVNAAHLSRVLGVIERAKADGAGRLVTGGSRLDGDLAGGYFVPPTVFCDVDNASALAQHEVFGPVLAVMPFADEAEAVRLANDTPYDLAAYVFTNELDRAHRVAARLRAGTVSVNSTFGYLAPNTPFGGSGGSGFGREGGRAGLEEFLRPKHVYIHNARSA